MIIEVRLINVSIKLTYGSRGKEAKYRSEIQDFESKNIIYQVRNNLQTLIKSMGVSK